MADSGIRDKIAARRSGGFGNVGLFISPSASMDRCSFEISQVEKERVLSRLAGNEFSQHQNLTGPVLELSQANRVPHLRNAKSHLTKNAEIDKAHMFRDSKIPSRVEAEGPALDVATNSFSPSLREFQARRPRSEALVNKAEWRTPNSFDPNTSAGCVVSPSPRPLVIKKSVASPRLSSEFPNPVTPSYHHGSVNLNHGACSERVSLQCGAATGQGGTTMLPPSNGRTLPFKWEDAERWILCPVDSKDCAARPSYQQPKKQQKSRSGPLGSHGIAQHAIDSPTIGMCSGSDVKNLTAASSFPAGSLMADSSSVHHAGGNNGSFSKRGEPCITHSPNLLSCTDSVCQSSESSSQVEVIEDAKDAAAKESFALSRGDMATKMSPLGSSRSSSMRRLSFRLSTPSTLPVMEVRSVGSLKPHVKDVQVDERVTVTRWSKKHKPLISGKGSKETDDWRLKAIRSCSSALDVSERSNCPAKTNRVEDKISAWENLQKEKAEVALRKLEMKLEKKKLTSVSKIMNKLRSAQRKAQEMRSSVSSNEVDEETKASFNPLSLSKMRQIGSLSGCFTCHVRLLRGSQ